MTDVRSARSRATIQDVADEAGLSRGTVSRVLNDEPYVSAEAREAVQAAVRRVGYVRSAAARSLVTRRSGPSRSSCTNRASRCSTTRTSATS